MTHQEKYYRYYFNRQYISRLVKKFNLDGYNSIRENSTEWIDRLKAKYGSSVVIMIGNTVNIGLQKIAILDIKMESIWYVITISDNRRYINISSFEQMYNFVEYMIEHYSADLKQYMMKKMKQKKITDMARSNISTIVRAKMSQTEYQWNLIEEDTRCVLQIKMPRNQMIEITLGYKSFTNKLDELLNVIEQTQQLMSSLPFGIVVRDCIRNIYWVG
ncbi:MAG: hypothetical protein II707_06275 [Spirochaetales bacterium]|nr:hypothetical protein [Spirochaetales bacterium]